MAYIGIDLGTTTSEIAVFRDGKAEIIKNIEEGESSIVPSIVLIDKGNIVVGDKAKNQMILKADKVISEVKRFMGEDVNLKIDGKVYSPVKISSMILKKMKDIAEFYLGEEVTEAVITVPANFNDKGRRNTKEAGKLAGLNVKRIINEPTAASLSYGLDKEDKDMKILVFDFGGGTLDITILEMVNKVIDVRVSRGNNKLGGKDIDKILMKYIIKRVEKETGQKINTKNLRSLSMLKKASEECKKNLAFHKEWAVIIPGIDKDEDGNLIDVDCTIKREQFNLLIKKIIKEAEALIDEALKSAKMKERDIDKIVLVGGSTRIVEIKKMFKRKFGEEKIVKGINPDEAVALGASIQSAIRGKEIEKNIVVIDTANHTLGVEVLGGVFDPIIERDSKLPAEETKYYKTVEDDQNEVYINLYQGENKLVRDNTFIDRIEMKKIPKNKKGKEVVEIKFKYDLDGILKAEVKIISTGEMEKRKFKDGKALETEKEEKLVNKKENKKIKKKPVVEEIDIDIDIEDMEEIDIEDIGIEKVEEKYENIKNEEFNDIDEEDLEEDIEVEEDEKIEEDDEIEEDEEIEEDDEIKEDEKLGEKIEEDLDEDSEEEFDIEEIEKEELMEELEEEEVKDEKIDQVEEVEGRDKEVEEKLEEEREKEEQSETEEDEGFEDNGDYTNIFGEVYNLVTYVNANMESYEEKVQEKVKLLLQDLLGVVQNEKFPECRQIEYQILTLIGVS